MGGFTLIEVLVALAIAALGLSFLIIAVDTGLQNADLASRYIQATQRARSYLAEVGVTVPIARSEYSGNDSDGFHWRISIAQPISEIKIGDTNSTNSQTLGLYPVDVSVSWRDGLQRKMIFLHSERIGAQ